MSMELVKAEQAPEQQQVAIPDVLPVLPLPDMVVFPYMIIPLFVNRERSAKAVDQALAENRMILLISQKNAPWTILKPKICTISAQSRSLCECSSCRMDACASWYRAS